MRLFLIVFLVATALAVPARAEQFMAPLSRAEWLVEGSPVSCRLKQVVPRYGDAIFEAVAGGQQSFVLRAPKNPLLEGPAAWVAAAPPWNPQRAPVALGSVEVSAGAEALRLGAESQRLLDSLDSGLSPQFSRPLQARRDVQARVALSPLNFRPAYRRYRQCLEGLLPVSYEQIASTTLVFPRERAELTAEAQRKIDTVLRYAQADRSITGFSVLAVSADTPRRLDNLAIARERAEQVQEYLRSRGIAAARIDSEWRGERGGHSVRTVTIRLRRAER